MTIIEALAWLISEGGAVTAAYKLMECVPKLAKLAPEPKRYVALGIAGVGAAAIYAGAIGLRLAAMPVDWRDWVITLINTALTAALAGQVVHARVVLKQKS